MGTIAYTVPQAGTDLNSIADAEIATALTTIKTWANGNIDQTNLSTALQAIVIPGSWVALTLGTNIGAAAGFYTPSSRPQGDVVRLKGVLKATANEPDSTPMATLAVGHRPANALTLAVPTGTSLTGATITMQPIVIATNGQISTANGLGLANATYVVLDGVTFSMS